MTVPGPPLITPRAVTRIEDYVRASVVKTRVVTANLPGLTPQPVLVTSLKTTFLPHRDKRRSCYLIMTRPHPDGFVLVLRLGAGVDTDVGLDVPDVALSHSVARDEQLGKDCVQIPLEALALQVLPELLPTADVPVLAQLVPDPVVVILLVLVQPDLGEPDAVPDHYVHVAPPLIRRPLAEDVAHMAAGNYLHCTAAHPGLEGKL